ncbi:checkpoint clamp complex protein Hus1 [Saitoella complicata NRRL Y-17804]|uniref:Checkpoint protein n=1 Tax=Saitoella complicata (strain BCRC 22490 / CBS 7301 / JCM 7358 / NBRC 10748 / NRRL Y-17804) TaxID=698492 RepID=A0A0E9NFP9_SAICN|nr:checkpoint clamp complex protein Hus1 [Saitoella complicata NRRL Y-17804]ODQ51946.1 checkpoint clamp complex protein Hus1 [Saitoella complicata NRRL Y-17804]GAO48664.1 hypothetical protein G7K_2834-t1 [Saitoella complicata NRRL Y-17804]
MRFRTGIRNISTFTKLAHSLERLKRRECILRLTPDAVHFIIVPDTTGTQVWAAIGVETLFDDDYHIQSNANNTINLEFNIENLTRSLRSASSATEVQMRLTKRDKHPMLSFIITLPGHGGGTNVVTQDIHVRVLTLSYVASIREPICPEPDVHIILPPLGVMRQHSERFQRLSDKIILRANMSGSLHLLAHSDSIRIQTAWTNLINPELDPAQVPNPAEHPSQLRPKDKFASVRIDAKEWVSLLRVSVVAKRVIACFCEGHALVLYVYVTEPEEEASAVLTYYIPIHSE